jgi:hypothetical protein
MIHHAFAAISIITGHDGRTDRRHGILQQVPQGADLVEHTGHVYVRQGVAGPDLLVVAPSRHCRRDLIGGLGAGCRLPRRAAERVDREPTSALKGVAKANEQRLVDRGTVTDLDLLAV